MSFVWQLCVLFSCIEIVCTVHITNNPQMVQLSSALTRSIDQCSSNDFESALQIIQSLVNECFAAIGQSSKDTFLINVWADNKAPILYNADVSSLFFECEIIATLSLHLMDYYIKHKITDKQYQQHEKIKIFENELENVIKTLNTRVIYSTTFTTSRKVALLTINEQCKGTNWCDNKIFSAIYSILVRNIQLMNALKHSLNLEIVEKIGLGSFGHVYKLKSLDTSSNNVTYALKSFSSLEHCAKEENILKILKHAKNASIAHIRSNDVINCSSYNAFMLDFIDGEEVDHVSPDIIRSHKNGLLGFIKDFSDTLMSVFSAIKPLFIAHSDLSGRNVMYDIYKKQFFVIDWGKAHIISNEYQSDLSDHGFYGTIQNFGHFGVKLHQRIKKKLIYSDIDIQINLNLARNNDIYAMRAVQLGLIGIHAPKQQEMVKLFGARRYHIDVVKIKTLHEFLGDLELLQYEKIFVEKGFDELEDLYYPKEYDFINMGIQLVDARKLIKFLKIEKSKHNHLKRKSNILETLQNLHKVSHDTARKILKVFNDDKVDWISNSYNAFYSLWCHRSDVIQSSVELLDYMNITKPMIDVLTYNEDVIDSLWLNAMNTDSFEDALGAINMDIIDPVHRFIHFLHGKNHELVSYKELFLKIFTGIPSFLIKMNEHRVHSYLLQQNRNIDALQSFNLKRLAVISIKFIQMYCEKYLEEKQKYSYVEAADKLLQNIIIGTQTVYTNGSYKDELKIRGLVDALIPVNHPLNNRIVDLLDLKKKQKNVRFKGIA
eukprot:8418_1